jgi:hypothetical protein
LNTFIRVDSRVSWAKNPEFNEKCPEDTEKT